VSEANFTDPNDGISADITSFYSSRIDAQGCENKKLDYIGCLEFKIWKDP